MRAPRKVYLVPSRSTRDVPCIDDVCFSRPEADRLAADRNGTALDNEPKDWRVEPYVKGD